MKTLRTEHTYTSITERWDAVDAYPCFDQGKGKYG